MKLAPSILDTDFSCLGNIITELDQTDSDWIHLDVMDGNFVPRITFGDSMVRALKPFSPKKFDCHLMVTNPAKHLAAFAAAGADQITIHYEASKEIETDLKRIRQLGLEVGLAIIPTTRASEIAHLLPLVDLVLQMTVMPGAGGQAFIPDTMLNVDYLAQYRKEHQLEFLIQVDGGINAETASICATHGVDVLVAGSYLYKQPSLLKGIELLRESFDIGKA